MKTRIFLLLFVLAAMPSLQAQVDMGCIPYHNLECDIANLKNLMQQRDGDYLALYIIAVGEYDPPHGEIRIVGDRIYKISPSTLQVTDTLLIPNENPPYRLLAQDPRGEGNILAYFEYHADTDSTYLRISRFSDDNLQIDPAEDVVSPVCQGVVRGYYDSYMVDSRGDLIMKYYQDTHEGEYEGEYKCHIVRFGIDGTLKHEAILPQNQNFFNKVEMLSDSPLTYYHRAVGPVLGTHVDGNDRTCYIFDSAFNTIDTCFINHIVYEQQLSQYVFAREHFAFNSDAQIFIAGDELLVAGQYVCDTNYNPMTAECGVAVAKYNWHTMRCTGVRWFNDWPGWDKEGYCLGFQRMSDGTLYLMYTEVGKDNNPLPIYLVRMEPNLTVKWKREITSVFEGARLYGAESCILGRDSQKESMFVTGFSDYSYGDPLGAFYFWVNHDGVVNASEGVEVRPFSYYPNPAKDMLRMDFSPDVQPERIDLFDLQGRLVGSQANSFEHVDIAPLPGGIYTMRVTLKDGQTYSCKVVKE